MKNKTTNIAHYGLCEHNHTITFYNEVGILVCQCVICGNKVQVKDD